MYVIDHHGHALRTTRRVLRQAGSYVRRLRRLLPLSRVGRASVRACVRRRCAWTWTTARTGVGWMEVRPPQGDSWVGEHRCVLAAPFLVRRHTVREYRELPRMQGGILRCVRRHTRYMYPGTEFQYRLLRLWRFPLKDRHDRNPPSLYIVRVLL